MATTRWEPTQWTAYDDEAGQEVGSVELKYRHDPQWCVRPAEGDFHARVVDGVEVDWGEIGRYRTADDAKAALEAWWKTWKKVH